MQTLTDALERLARKTDRAPEVTEIIGGAVEAAYAAVDALDLAALSTDNRAGYAVTLDGQAVRVRVDPTSGWETPVPLAGAYWPTDVVSSLNGVVNATELSRRMAGATRVVRFTGTVTVPGALVNRIMATPNVVDVHFLPGRFDVLLAREAPTLGGLAHLVATRKIKRRRRRPVLTGQAVAFACAQLERQPQGKASE